MESHNRRGLQAKDEKSWYVAQSDLCDNSISFLRKHMLVLNSPLKEKSIQHYI